MNAKERMKIPPVDMPEQDPKVRVSNLDEVPLGYTPEMAMLEASRCIQCKTAFCIGYSKSNCITSGRIIGMVNRSRHA